eukprot:CAMPEP_0202105408 /NCGR_PEP_ID=MMETSP0965-20130614/6021_1 /ASSEMBLY_ACC=CAM_ASM_000507 /TAXON_ID=4773 /ORGANISM="Schizochytrium aggregatum, Strain ATCC28209" /LENGTH=34 /DNA_ID= /DNA_START= /DNA_END= /DNA_ORIENTATION=
MDDGMDLHKAGVFHARDAGDRLLSGRHAYAPTRA